MLSLILISLILALVPAILFRANLRAYAPPPIPGPDEALPPISVLIPARNEEAAIGGGGRRGAEEPGRRVRGRRPRRSLRRPDGRDRAGAGRRPTTGSGSIAAPELPAGWCGKQHACWILARAGQASPARLPRRRRPAGPRRAGADGGLPRAPRRRPGERDPPPGDGDPAGEAAHPADPLHPAGLPADPQDEAEPSPFALGRVRPALHRAGERLSSQRRPRGDPRLAARRHQAPPRLPRLRASRPTSSTPPSWPPAGCTAPPARSGSAWPRTPARPWPPLP